MTLSELDYQQISVPLKQRAEGKRRIDLGNPPEVSKYPQKFSPAALISDQWSSMTPPLCLQVVAKQGWGSRKGVKSQTPPRPVRKNPHPRPAGGGWETK